MPPGVAAAATTAAGSTAAATMAAAPRAPATASVWAVSRASPAETPASVNADHPSRHIARHAGRDGGGHVEVLLVELDQRTAYAEQVRDRIAPRVQRTGHEQADPEPQGRRRRWE